MYILYKWLALFGVVMSDMFTWELSKIWMWRVVEGGRCVSVSVGNGCVKLRHFFAYRKMIMLYIFILRFIISIHGSLWSKLIWQRSLCILYVYIYFSIVKLDIMIDVRSFRFEFHTLIIRWIYLIGLTYSNFSPSQLCEVGN